MLHGAHHSFGHGEWDIGSISLSPSSTNLVNYLQIRLNQGNVTASNNVTNWSGTCYITPLIGAFLTDAYFSTYWIIAIFSIVYCVVSLF